jgi:hypothetical protein
VIAHRHIEHRLPYCFFPTDEVLVERRCLGQTELKVKPGQVGTSNATKPENLGMLDYAHLRVPLPKDLSGSGIFMRGPNRKFPEAYFLMVSRKESRVRYQSSSANDKSIVTSWDMHACVLVLGFVHYRLVPGTAHTQDGNLS